MPMTIRPKGSAGGKSPAILSHEFVIQNHADIVSCGAMLVAVGLMFQVTSPIASLFITLQHNITVEATAELPGSVWYTYGVKDAFTTFFYALIFIVVHAVVQEYIFDKLNRRMHLSKVKHAKFNESGQLLLFYAASAIWGIDIIIRENYVSNMSSLWENYPHVLLPFLVKFYFICQLAYWLHTFPELYFQKLKKDEIWAQVHYISLYLVFISTAFLLNLTRLALVLLVLHYIVEFLFHASRLLYFSEKTDFSNSGFKIWNVLFVLVRLMTITLAALTFWYGLPKSPAAAISFADGNFNTQIVRVNCLVAVSLLQAWMMWRFITFQLGHTRDPSQAAALSSSTAVGKKATSPKSPTKKKKGKGGRDADESRSEEPSGGDEPSVENGMGEGSVRQRNTKNR
jgi:translocating chain-associated membrane protein 1